MIQFVLFETTFISKQPAKRRILIFAPFIKHILIKKFSFSCQCAAILYVQAAGLNKHFSLPVAPARTP